MIPAVVRTTCSRSNRAVQTNDSWYWCYLKGWWNLSSGPYYHNGYYCDLSDHYPVVATFRY